MIYQLKGSNVQGSLSNPEGSELILDKEASGWFKVIYNLPLILDSLNLEDYFVSQNLNNFLSHFSKTVDDIKSFNEFDSLLNKEFKDLYYVLNQYENKDVNSKTKKDLKKAIEDAKKNLNNEFSIINKVKNEAKKLRNKYVKNINTSNKKIFNINYKTQKAHIYNVEWIKEDAVEFWKNNNEKIAHKTIGKKIQKILNEIADEFNYLNLESNIHASFDNYEFTYDENGVIHKLKDDFIKNIREEIINSYRQIPKENLTKKMKYYINKRNKHLSSLNNDN
ncbi:hypothetical protein Q8852_02360 [Mycoplasma seminis]|uniref:Uncharacterized protein n=1 Tax=Mycoplasma seminis TaxID=512749 RepID=A0ABY9H9Q9_9MOLU|nr:hypothetical protein [Mycoplasma seminis]WLP85146.1 hypothetical protein Q8852_02360 [Mycoplasma seminis]